MFHDHCFLTFSNYHDSGLYATQQDELTNKIIEATRKLKRSGKITKHKDIDGKRTSVFAIGIVGI